MPYTLNVKVLHTVDSAKGAKDEAKGALALLLHDVWGRGGGGGQGVLKVSSRDGAFELRFFELLAPRERTSVCLLCRYVCMYVCK